MSYVYNYIQWFYKVLHPYMTLDAEGDPLRSVHREILEEEQTKVNHIVDVLSICHYIVTIRRESITRGEFRKGIP